MAAIAEQTTRHPPPELTEPQRLGGILRRARVAPGLNQGEAGRLVGTQQRRISRIEAGGTVALSAVLDYAAALRRAGNSNQSQLDS